MSALHTPKRWRMFHSVSSGATTYRYSCGAMSSAFPCAPFALPESSACTAAGVALTVEDELGALGLTAAAVSIGFDEVGAGAVHPVRNKHAARITEAADSAR